MITPTDIQLLAILSFISVGLWTMIKYAG